MNITYFWHWGCSDDWINVLFILSGLKAENYCRRELFCSNSSRQQESHDIGITEGLKQKGEQLEREKVFPRERKKAFLPIIDIYVLGAPPYTFEPN